MGIPPGVDNATQVRRKITIAEDGRLTGPDTDQELIIRTSAQDGFWAGCTFVSWEAWDRISDIAKNLRRHLKG